MTVRRCVVCRDPLGTEPQVCARCLAAVRSAVMEVVELYALLPSELADHAGAATPPDGSGTHGTNDGLPEALVLLGPGSAGANQVRDLIAGRDDSHADDELAGHPPSVVGELGRWEDDWRIVQREQGMRVSVAANPATVTGSAAYLLDSMAWAGRSHPTFDNFAADMRVLVAALRRVTRTASPVERGVPCPYCATVLLRDYAKPARCDHPARPHCDHSDRDPQHWGCHGSSHCPCDQGGRRDQWRCADSDCGRTFTEREYLLAVWSNWDALRGDVDSHRAHLASSNGTVAVG